MTALLRCGASFLVLIATALLHAQNSSEIDPMLGADKGGNVFVGPTLPFGMAKPGPDYGDNEGNAGWEASGALNGLLAVACFGHRRRAEVWQHPGATDDGQSRSCAQLRTTRGRTCRSRILLSKAGRIGHPCRGYNGAPNTRLSIHLPHNRRANTVG